MIINNGGSNVAIPCYGLALLWLHLFAAAGLILALQGRAHIRARLCVMPDVYLPTRPIDDGLNDYDDWGC